MPCQLKHHRWSMSCLRCPQREGAALCVIAICRRKLAADRWSCRSDAEEVKAAVDYFHRAKSYRDTGDAALHAKHKLVLQDSLLEGSGLPLAEMLWQS